MSLISLGKLRVPLQHIVATMALGVFSARGDEVVEPPAPTAEKLDALLERFQRMEEANRALTEKVEQLSRENSDLSQELRQLSNRVREPEKDAEPESFESEPPNSSLAGQGSWEQAIERERDQEAGDRPSQLRGSGGGGVSGGARIREPQDVGNRHLGRIPLLAFFDYEQNGIGLSTEDDEFQFKFRTELQADSLIFPGPARELTHSGVYIPRARFYFQGHATKPIDYQLSFQRSLSGFDMLNVFLNFNYDKRLQFRIGRFKPPFTYERYKLNNWRLIAPERSLFVTNFNLNRMTGLMGWGLVRDERLEYAVGIFAGPRSSVRDYNSKKDVVAMLNYRPFSTTESFLTNLNIGGSMDYGMQDNPADPAVLRTNVNASSQGLASTEPIASATVPFFAFNSDVVERGRRELWGLHLAYYYGGLSLIAEWGKGVDAFAKRTGPSVPMSVGGWSVAAAYLLTGETLSERTVIDPIHRFDLRKGKFGLGAFEPFARFSALEIGDDVFKQGLADPNLWTNRAWTTDVGVNWYLNRMVKVYLNWQHAGFGDPVFYRAGGLRSTSDILWMRVQFYY